jgi:ATP-dependent DNA helicase RecG
MIKSCSDAGLPPPEFKELGARFRVTIYTQAITTPKIDDVDQKIIEAIKKSDGLSTSEISTIIGMSTRSVRDRLKKLQALNYFFNISTGPYDPNKRFKLKK